MISTRSATRSASVTTQGMQLVSYEEMNGEGFDDPVGSSVMDYLPVNIAFGEDIVQALDLHHDRSLRHVGDRVRLHGDTKAVLARANEPELIYATDEDTPGPDPMARQFDHAENPLDYETRRSRLCRNSAAGSSTTWSRTARLSRPACLRDAPSKASWRDRDRQQLDRWHHRQRARRAWTLDRVHPRRPAASRVMFVLNSMPDDAYGSPGAPPEDDRREVVRQRRHPRRTARRHLPIHQSIASAQNSVLTQVINPSTLNRVFDNEFRAGPDEDVRRSPRSWTRSRSRSGPSSTATPTVAERLRTRTSRACVTNIQRSHLSAWWISPASPTASVRAARRSISRHQLPELEEQIGETLSRDGNRLDPYTEPLADAKSIIDRVLNSDYIYSQVSGGGGGITAAFFEARVHSRLDDIRRPGGPPGRRVVLHRAVPRRHRGQEPPDSAFGRSA